MGHKFRLLRSTRCRDSKYDSLWICHVGKTRHVDIKREFLIARRKLCALTGSIHNGDILIHSAISAFYLFLWDLFRGNCVPFLIRRLSAGRSSPFWAAVPCPLWSIGAGSRPRVSPIQLRRSKGLIHGSKRSIPARADGRI